jgi:hypothetical protein
VNRTEAAEARAIAKEEAQILKAGGIFCDPAPPCYPYFEVPPQSKWLPCWKKVFRITVRNKGE